MTPKKREKECKGCVYYSVAFGGWCSAAGKKTVASWSQCKVYNLKKEKQQ